MRIAVSADTKDGLDSAVCPHFGRCPHFILVDLDDREVSRVREVDNPFFGQHQLGPVPGFISILGADVLLTGGMGAQAITFFQQYGIKGVTGAHGTVSQSVERYLDGQVQSAAPRIRREEHRHGNEHEHLPAEGEYENDEFGRLREEAEMPRRQSGGAGSRLGRMGQ